SFTPGTGAAERAAAVRKHAGRVVEALPRLGAYRVVVDADRGPDAKPSGARASELAADARIARAEPNYLYRATFTPNDPSLGQQWAWGKVGAYAAWDTTRGSAATKIAVIDTGVQRSHPDLDAKIVAGYDWVSGDTAPDDAHGHGTHVAGTAAAETNNATGGAGMCPECRIMPLRVLNAQGSGTLANVASAIRYAADNGAKVINLSLGGPGSATLQSAVDYAFNRGSFLACAAGNSNTSSTSSAYPAAYPNCFAVASTTSTDARSSFSNYGSWVEVAAPGSSIYSAWLNSGYNTISGTSMATPHVAGLAGLLASQGLTHTQIRDGICNSADKISGTGTYWTCGRINAAAAVGGSPPPPPPPPATNVIVNGGFESGTAPWVQSSSGGYQLITTTRPHSGSYSAWLGGYNSATESITQAVTVPANGTLRYWWYMTTSESGSTVWDTMRVRVYDANTGALLATPRTWSNASGAGLWREDTLSLASYAGRSVRIQFAAQTDYSLPTSFFVDDVSLR
ncbi:MAG: S8 family serine peptidase, partial [Micromonosporaceae bacterium]